MFQAALVIRRLCVHRPGRVVWHFAWPNVDLEVKEHREWERFAVCFDESEDLTLSLNSSAYRLMSLGPGFPMGDMLR